MDSTTDPGLVDADGCAMCGTTDRPLTRRDYGGTDAEAASIAIFSSPVVAAGQRSVGGAAQQTAVCCVHHHQVGRRRHVRFVRLPAFVILAVLIINNIVCR